MWQRDADAFMQKHNKNLIIR